MSNTPRFFAEPPPQIHTGSLLKHWRDTIVRLWHIVRQILCPFEARPREIDPIPEPKVRVTPDHVSQCQWIFDQAKERRVQLEQKAQSTFGLMVFLVPLLAALFGFMISSAGTADTTMRAVSTILLVVTACFLLLGFISAVRAVSVKTIETLYLNAVIDSTDGQFRKYSGAFHARGLLYCAAMNEAMNDHLAQFVKGAHVLTTAAVISLVVAAGLTGYVSSGLPSSPADTKSVGTVDVSSSEVATIRDDVASLKGEVGRLLSHSQTTEDDMRRLRETLGMLDTKLSEIHQAMPPGPGAPPESGREQ